MVRALETGLEGATDLIRDVKGNIENVPLFS
jgi:hypothetical protein